MLFDNSSLHLTPYFAYEFISMSFRKRTIRRAGLPDTCLQCSPKILQSLSVSFVQLRRSDTRLTKRNFFPRLAIQRRDLAENLFEIAE